MNPYMLAYDKELFLLNSLYFLGEIMIESVTFTPVTLIFKTEFDTEVNYHDAKHLWFALTVVFDQYHRQPICE